MYEGDHQRARKEVDRIFGIADKDGSGKISYAEFKSAFVSKEVLLQDDKLKQMFAKLDEDGSGFISLEEFKSAFVGKQMSDWQWKKMICQVDKDGSGTITFEEFKAMMCSIMSHA